MPSKDKDHRVMTAIRMIKGYQTRVSTAGPGGRCWQLQIPIWQLALEGVAVFGIAFVSGLGLGVLYHVIMRS